MTPGGSRGASTALKAAALAVVIVGAAAGYLLLSGGLASHGAATYTSPTSALTIGSTSCTSSSAVSGSNITVTLNPSPMPIFASYNSETMVATVGEGGQSSNSTESFDVLYRSATTYKIALESELPGLGSFGNTSVTAWVLVNGTALAAESSVLQAGENQTGAGAAQVFASAVGSFEEQADFVHSQSFFTDNPQYFHSSGNSSVSIGGRSVTVDTYTLNSPDEEIVSCGSTSVLTAFSASVGTPVGATFPLVTSLVQDTLVNSTAAPGTQTPLDLSLQLTGFATAS